jgi:hypothetical protein
MKIIPLQVSNLRALAIDLLDDPNGISKEAYGRLGALLFDAKVEDVPAAVQFEHKKERYFLDEDTAFDLRKVGRKTHLFSPTTGCCVHCGISANDDAIENGLCIIDDSQS